MEGKKENAKRKQVFFFFFYRKDAIIKARNRGSYWMPKKSFTSFYLWRLILRFLPNNLVVEFPIFLFLFLSSIFYQTFFHRNSIAKCCRLYRRRDSPFDFRNWLFLTFFLFPVFSGGFSSPPPPIFVSLLLYHYYYYYFFLIESHKFWDAGFLLLSFLSFNSEQKFCLTCVPATVNGFSSQNLILFFVFFFFNKSLYIFFVLLSSFTFKLIYWFFYYYFFSFN